MEDSQKPDFKRYTSPPVSKWYLARILVYVIVLVLLGVAIYTLKPNQQAEKEITEIGNITIELNDSLSQP